METTLRQCNNTIVVFFWCKCIPKTTLSARTIKTRRKKKSE